MRINEIFYSIQGEGKTIGQPRLFIRLSGCNLQCDFCDSKFHIKINKVDEKLLRKYKKWVITGGEPTLQQNLIEEAMKKYKPTWVEIETNGTIPISEYLEKNIDLWNISPKNKINQIGKQNTKVRIKTDYLKDYIIKLVYTDKKNEKFIESFKKYKDRIFIMPEGISREEQVKKTKKIIKYCLINNYNFSPRVHVLVWDKKRKV